MEGLFEFRAFRERLLASDKYFTIAPARRVRCIQFLLALARCEEDPGSNCDELDSLNSAYLEAVREARALVRTEELRLEGDPRLPEGELDPALDDSSSPSGESWLEGPKEPTVAWFAPPAVSPIASAPDLIAKSTEPVDAPVAADVAEATDRIEELLPATQASVVERSCLASEKPMAKVPLEAQPRPAPSVLDLNFSDLEPKPAPRPADRLGCAAHPSDDIQLGEGGSGRVSEGALTGSVVATAKALRKECEPARASHATTAPAREAMPAPTPSARKEPVRVARTSEREDAEKDGWELVAMLAGD